MGLPLLAILSFAKENKTITNISNSEVTSQSIVKKTRVDFHINGCHVVGWIETWGPYIIDYDIHIYGPNGHAHYQGKMSINDNGETKIEGTLSDEKGNTLKLDDENIKLLTEINNYVKKQYN